MSNSLTVIADRAGTDKGSTKHYYTSIYERLFEPLRDQPINLLEFGLSIGGPELDNSASREVASVPSILMWQEYFAKAHVFGADISDCSRFQRDRFTFWQVDCGDRAALRALADKGVQFDIILDDASHASFHQQLTLAEMFPSLKSRGLYIIEDLNWQPETYERTLPQAVKTADLLENPSDPFWKQVSGVSSIRTYTRDELFWISGKRNLRAWRWRLGLPSKSNRVKLAIIQKS